MVRVIRVDRLHGNDFRRDVAMAILFPIVPYLMDRLLNMVKVAVNRQRGTTTCHFDVRVLARRGGTVLRGLVRIVLEGLARLRRVSGVVREKFLFLRSFLRRQFLTAWRGMVNVIMDL